MESKIERRYFNSNVEIRAGDDGKPKGGKGLAAVFDTLSENLGGFREKIAKGAFDGVMDNDVRVLRDHEPGKILGRTSKGTAKISITDQGLAYQWDDPDTTYSRDLQKSMARGDVDQSSFGFTVADDDWEEDEEGRLIRTIKKVRELFDVSPVTFPAYPDATVAKRSMDKYLKSKGLPEKPKEQKTKTEHKKQRVESRSKQMTTMDRIKQLEDERQLLIDENESVIAGLQDGKGNSRAFTEEEKETVDSNDYRIDQIEHELKKRKNLEARKAKDKEETEQKKRTISPLVGHETPAPDSEEREAAQFSFTKFLNEARKRSFTGLERDMVKEGEKSIKESGAQPQGNGFIIPQVALEARRREFRAPMTSGTVASPGEAGKAVTEEIGSFIDALYATLAVTQAGADFQTGLVGNIKWPAENAVAAGTWEGETDANAESTPTVSNVSMAPLRVGTYVDISNQALIQTSPSIGARIQRQMVTAIAQAVDIAAINGSGTAPVPEGILNTTGIGSVALGTDGAAPTWASIVNLEREVAIDNALMGNLSYVTNSKALAKLKTIKKDDGSGIFLVDALMGEGGMQMNNHRIVVSNNVPSDLTKGMGSALSAIIFGNFNDLIVGQWGGVEVLVDPYTQATTATTRYVINSFHDVAVLRAVSFAAIVDAVTT